MQKIYKVILAFSIMLVSVSTFAQKNFFTDISETSIKATPGKHDLNPEKYRGISMDVNGMKTFLWALPLERNVLYNRNNTPVLALPMPDGTIGRFHVWESSIQEKGLEDKFPEIKTFAGQGIDDPYATIRFDYSPYLGFHAQILSAVTGRIYIDPYARGNVNNYMSYFHSDNKRDARFECRTDLVNNLPQTENVEAGPCRGTVLTTYRLAVTVTGEYAQTLSGVTVGGATPGLPGPTHAGVVASANRVTGLYEQDLAIRLVLVANNNLVEFLDPATDPFANDGSIAELNIITGVINGLVGVANYDVGHLFCTNESGGVGAGVAGVAVVCTGSKGRGLTGRLNPTGDGYDIDYVAHELGHQFSAQHTFNTNTCFSAGGSFEPGGGTTIMAYAGICSANENIQPNSDAVFHAKSFDDISNFLATGSGGACGVTTPTGNILPVITSTPNNNVSIPINTPFTLTATATDANGDALTYNWEGWDAGAAGSWTSAATSTNRALFRTRVSKTTGSRTFPDPRVTAANYPGTAAPSAMDGLRGETLPQVARVMKFRLSVRDNRAAGGGTVSIGDGCQDATSFTINAVGTAPFAVTVPNGGESYPSGSSQTITWNIVGTNAAPFNVSNVKISFSNDGGLTFPTVILASTANDGSELVSMPAITTTLGRVKVEAIGNIFFDISNTNFTLTAPVSDFAFGAAPTNTSTVCPAAATMSATLLTTATGGFANPITLATTSGVPAGTTISFGTNPVTPGSSSVVTLNNANTLAAGTYVVGISGTATGTAVKNTSVTFIINPGTAPVITSGPVSTIVCAPAQANFTVVTAAVGATYQWQSAPSAAGTFTNVTTGTGGTTASYTTVATSAAMNNMVYRCLVSTLCSSVLSSVATLTVNTAAVITTQPTNQTACTGATATFTAAATGTGVSYQWQSATTAGGPWTSVGSNSPTYTTVPLTVTTPTFYQVIVSTTLCPASVTSTTATLGVSVTTAIGTQPTAQVVCAGATASYTVAATGTAIAYQWQSATSAAGPWTNVGTNSNTYTTAATTAGMNGMFFQVIVTGSCNAVTSTPMMLTVNTAAIVTTNPSATTVCNGVTASFIGAGTGTGATYQWQVSTTGIAGTYSPVTGGTGATTPSYTTITTTPAMNGNYYRLEIKTTTCAATVYTTPALLTVNTVAVIGTQPTAQAACIPQTATFTVAATGTGLTYQWQSAPSGSTTFTDITGATSAIYTTGVSVLTMNGNQYRVSILSTCGLGVATVSTAAILTVTNPVAITQQPAAQSGCIGDNYTFTSNASSSGNTITYQWQSSTTGAVGTFTNIAGANNAPAGTVSPVNATYTINGANANLNNTFYRVYFNVPCGTGISADTSAAAKLTLSNRPTVVLTQAATSNTNGAVNSRLTTTVSPVGNFTFNWKRNGTIIPNTLASTFISLPVDDAATYTVTVSDPSTGCTSAASTVTTTALTSDNLINGRVIVYPNPVSSIMFVRYNTSTSASRGTMLNVYNEKGARVFSKEYNIVSTNGRMAVDMSRFALGTYMVYIMDASGKKLGASKVVKIQ
jgi:Metallo-peptidase family M12B Reprolysin-like/Secretion system C-terminal sorting domain